MPRHENSSGNLDYSVDSKEQQKTIDYLDEALLSKRAQKSKHIAKDIEAYKQGIVLNNLKSEYEERKKRVKEAEDYAHQLRQDALNAEYKTRDEKLAAYNKAIKEQVVVNLEDSFQKVVDKALSGISSVSDEIDKRMNTYIESQTSVAAHLTGSSSTIDSINTSMEKITGQGLVKSDAVYNNLTSLVKQGIVSNVEQKAFLQTLANDIDATFNASDGTLVRLINLQKEDLSSNRLAIEYSLQEFLNQNYETSTYIKESFQDVSRSLLEMQSLMGSGSSAMRVESVIQAYLGSLYSSGMSGTTVSSIASAINALGSGDTSSLGSGISNLVLMAASRGGLSYSDILANGINEKDTNTLMRSLAAYMAELYNSGNNITRSQLASTFGVTVSDLVAAQNFQGTDIAEETKITTDIYSALLNGFSELVPLSTQIKNYLDNIVSSNAFTYSSNGWAYLAHTVYNLSVDAAAAAVKGLELGTEVSAFGLVSGTVTKDLSDIVSAAKLLNILPGVASALISGAGSLLSGASGASYFYDILKNDSKFKSSGSGFNGIGSSTSASAYVGNGDTSDVLNQTLNSSNDTLQKAGYTGSEESYSTTDVYKLLDAGSVKSFGLWADSNYNYSKGIAEVVNSDMNTNIASIAAATLGIYDLLDRKLDEIIAAVALSGNSLSYAVENINAATTLI